MQAVAVSGGGSLSLQSVRGSISGLAVADSTFSMDAASTASLGGTIRFENAGAVELTGKTIAAVGRHVLHAFRVRRLLIIP